MRILVTGAAGFVGGHVVRSLLGSGHEVGALLRLTSRADRLAGLEGPLSYIRSGLDDDAVLRAEIARWEPDACIHLAWYAEPGKYLAATENLSCLSDSLRLLEAVAAAGCRHVVMAGTCAEYDADRGYLREDGPLKPGTLYASTKLALCHTAAARAAQLGVGLSWARLFYLYGPQEDPRRLVPSVITSLLREIPFDASAGSQVRDYLHVADVAAALCALAQGGAGGVFNVCSGEPVSVRHLLSTLGAIMGRNELIRFGALPARGWDPAFICGDNGRLRQATGWLPRHRFEEGLAETVAWWKAQPPGERAA